MSFPSRSFLLQYHVGTLRGRSRCGVRRQRRGLNFLGRSDIGSERSRRHLDIVVDAVTQGREDLQSVQDLVAGDGVPSTDRKLEVVGLDLEHGVPSFVEVELRDAAIDDSFERLKEFFLESGWVVSLDLALFNVN